jgi:hypothetical protein
VFFQVGAARTELEELRNPVQERAPENRNGRALAGFFFGAASFATFRVALGFCLDCVPDDYGPAVREAVFRPVAHFHKYKHFTERTLLVVSRVAWTARTVIVATSETM